MAGRIPKAFIDELISRADIVDLIGSRVPLKKAGREFKACCPFHDEKTASFSVVPAKQFYHCFGCGAHGTALSFLMEYERLDFVDAVETLAADLGIDVPREAGQNIPRPDEGLYAVMAEAETIYRDELKVDRRAIKYLKQRGLSGETAARYGLGYAPDTWDRVLKALGGDGRRSTLLSAGLVIEKDADRAYDRFRDRIVFPIRDGRGRCIGFGGRVLDKGEPKYLNSPETPLFHKGRELYGLFEARQANKDPDSLIVVEGYMDVVALAEHGISNCVATLGTATTPDHLKRLFRVCDEVVFCFDGDRAGRAAAWRALENALPQSGGGRQIRFLFLPDGEDPDSLVREKGAEEFERLLKDAMPLSEYLISNLSEQVDMKSIDGRARFAELARPLVQQIPSGAFRELMAQQIADLSGSASGVRRLLAGESKTPRRSEVKMRSVGRGDLMRQAIAMLLQYPSVAAEAGDTDWVHGREGGGYRILGQLLDEAAANPNISTAGLIEKHRDTKEAAALMKLAALETLVDRDIAASEFRDLLKKLRREGDAQRLDQLLNLARTNALDDGMKAELKMLLDRRNDTDDGQGDIGMAAND